LPELLTNEGETYLTAFCTCTSKFVNDKINYAFSLAFTTSPDGIPQHHDSLHGCHNRRGTGTAIIEAKLAQQLSYLELKPFYGVFLDL
jgi:hypothetical protein